MENKKRSAVRVSPSGLQIEILAEGDGLKAQAGENAVVKYVLRFLDELRDERSVWGGQSYTIGWTPDPVFAEILPQIKLNS